MKIIKSIGEPFEFAFDGLRKIEIGKEGTPVSESDMIVINQRFGNIITVEEASIDDVIADAQSSDGAKTEEKTEEKPLAKMNRDELVAKATELGITVEENDTKKIIHDKIEAVLA